MHGLWTGGTWLLLVVAGFINWNKGVLERGRFLTEVANPSLGDRHALLFKQS